MEFVFDNQDGGFGAVEFSEVSIARRLTRGGEGQYLVNKAAVRRTDLVELLADVGLGGGMHSIVSQGKVDAVLASRPEDRRALIEEAAGLGKFKRRRHRAELKLARVATQVERARDVEDEVRKRLRPLALQATAAERAEKLYGSRSQNCELVWPTSTWPGAALFGAYGRGRRSVGRRPPSPAAAPRSDCRRCSASGRQPRKSSATPPAVVRRALGALYRLRSAGERTGLRREGRRVAARTGSSRELSGLEAVETRGEGRRRHARSGETGGEPRPPRRPERPLA